MSRAGRHGRDLHALRVAASRQTGSRAILQLACTLHMLETRDRGAIECACGRSVAFDGMILYCDEMGCMTVHLSDRWW